MKALITRIIIMFVVSLCMAGIAYGAIRLSTPSTLTEAILIGSILGVLFNSTLSFLTTIKYGPIRDWVKKWYKQMVVKVVVTMQFGSVIAFDTKDPMYIIAFYLIVASLFISEAE